MRGMAEWERIVVVAISRSVWVADFKSVTVVRAIASPLIRIMTYSDES